MGACSSNGVQREIPDHPRANTSVQERKAPEQHPQHGVEGRAPHRAEAFVAMRRSEDSLAVTTLHTTGMTTGPSQDTTRYPEGGTSRKLTGPESPKGPTEGAGRTRRGTLLGGNQPSEATPNNTRKTHKTIEGDTNNTLQRPRHTRNTTGPQPTHQAQAEQAD